MVLCKVNIKQLTGKQNVTQNLLLQDKKNERYQLGYVLHNSNFSPGSAS
jgi:hypothetical protein